MKIFIPELGQKFVLTEPWVFDLVPEYRNDTLWTAMNFPSRTGYGYHARANPTESVELPPGTVLQLDRIYIKKDQANFNSVTFKLLETDHIKFRGLGFQRKKIKARFWVKLKELNNLEVEPAI